MLLDQVRDPNIFCAIRLDCAEAGVSVADLEHATGLHNGTISRYFAGTRYAEETRKAIEEAARKLGVKVSSDPWCLVRIEHADAVSFAGGGVGIPRRRALAMKQTADRLGVSLRQWAQAAGVPRSSLADLLSGRNRRRWVPAKVEALEKSLEQFGAEPEALKAEIRWGVGASPIRRAGEFSPLWDVFLRDSHMLDDQVLKHFGLDRDPFKNEISSADQIFRGLEFRRTFDKVKDGLKKRDFLALWAPIGTGKTILWKAVVDDLRRQPTKWKFVFPRSAHRARITPSALYDALTEGLAGHIYCSGIQQKAATTQRLLEDADASGQNVVMLVDESHCLRRDVLRSLKLFLEHGIGFKRLLSILLIGQPELRTMLADVDLAEVGRRVTLIELGGIHVQGGRAGELGQFLEHKVGKVIWEESALKAIAELRNIYPAQETRDRSARTLPSILIQNVFAKAMELCAESSAKAVVSGEFVEQAVREART